MKLSVRKRKIIIQMCENELAKNYKNKTLNKNIRAIQRNMRASINDTETERRLTNLKEKE